MKMFKKLLLAGLAFTTLSVSAQTADEIVAKNIEAMGGAAKLATLTSVKKTGTASAQGQDFPITMTILHMKGFRMDLEIMGTSNYQIVTPEKSAMFFPIQQMTEPKEGSTEEVKEAQSALNIHGLYNYKEKGETIELAGDDKVDGADVYKLKVSKKEGKSAFYFIDKKTYRIVKITSKAKGQDGTEQDLETPYGDYKQNADGYWFAYTTAFQNGMVAVTYEKIESNVKVDESIFKQ
jgi:outer membrane lipoprotein-sorting protein